MGINFHHTVFKKNVTQTFIAVSYPSKTKKNCQKIYEQKSLFNHIVFIIDIVRVLSNNVMQF